MAGLEFTAWTTGEIAVSTTGEDIIMLITAPANQGVIIKSWGLFFDGTTATEAGVLCRLVELTGTITGGVAGQKSDNNMMSAATVQTTVTSENTAGTSFTAQGTAGDLFGQWSIHPQTGHGEFRTLDTRILVAGGSTVALTGRASAAVNVTGGLICEE